MWGGLGLYVLSDIFWAIDRAILLLFFLTPKSCNPTAINIK
jgi:hypothetical protein